ncbi:MAG: Ig-like domain-containing protein [Gemmatimonadaceae bacterium]|nr:Ig-like domain-containing protein [Gemmatimonadaceae bacterium]
MAAPRSRRHAPTAGAASAARRVVLPILTALLAACGGGDGGTPPSGPPASITVPSPTISVQGIGQTQTIAATVRDANNAVIAAPVVTWTSEAPGVATVAGTGATATVTGVARGTTTIRATAGSATASVTVTVRGVQSLTLATPPSLVRQTDTVTLRATVVADSGIATGVTWSTSDAAVASVTAAGLVTGVSPGNVTITATATAQPSLTARAQLQVTPPRAFAVRPDTVRLARTQTATITADLLLEPGANRTILWRTSNAGIANVSQTGVITGVAPGTATITALPQADTTLRRTVTAIISPLVTSVTVTPTSTQLFINQPLQLTATVNADAGANTTVRWVSANPATATVSATGVVTGVALGFTTITATSNQDSTRQAAVQVNVVRRPVSVTIVPSVIGTGIGVTSPVQVEVLADPGVSTAVTWATANPAIASIDRTTGALTGVALGTTTITATSVADPLRSATATVNVVPRLATRWGATRINGELVDDVTGIWCPRETACFAVSASLGDLFRWDGTAWRTVLRGRDFTSRRFLAIAGDATGSVGYAVGTGGLIARFNGAAWSQMQSGVTADLLEVAAGDNNTAAAVGVGGMVIRLQNSAWTRLTPPTGTGALNAVSFSQGSWFIAGDNGTLLRVADTTFTRLETNTVEHLRGVVGLTATSGVAVGDFGTILQFSSTQVTPVPTSITADLLHLSTGATGTLLAVGDGVVLQFTGTEWRRLTPPYATRLFAAYVDAGNNAIVTGQRGLVMDLRSGVWSTRSVAPDLLDVWSADATTAWAVGELGFVYRWNGSSWARQSAPTTQRLNGVWAASTTTAFAVGDSGTILRTTDGGTTWTAQTSPTRSDVIGVWGVSPTAVFAVGVGGEFLSWNGTAWQQVGALAPSALYGVFGSALTDVWSVGDNGLVYRNDGTQWTRSTINTTALLVGVWAASPSSVFTVGQSGDVAAAFRFNGTAWQSINPGTTSPLATIWGPNANDLYAVGANGTIVRFDGNQWSTMPSGTTDFLWSVAGTAGGTGGLAVGFNSTVLVANLAPQGLMSAQLGGTASLAPGRGARAGSRLLPEGSARRTHRLPRR